MTQAGMWRREALAGATIWALLVPSALAYSGIVGVEPLVGLVLVPFALVGYALFGGSKILVVGPDAAVSVLVASTLASGAVAKHGAADDALVGLTFCVAGVFLAMRLLRLGWVADVIPESVIKGFVQGLVLVTVADQVPKLIGADAGPLDGGFFNDVADIAGSLDTAQGTTAALGLSTLAALFAIGRWLPRWPAALLVLIASGVAVGAADLTSHGVDVVGEPTGQLFSTGIAIPTNLELIWDLLPGAIAIVVLGFTESLGASQLVAQSNGEQIRPDRELLGLGAANLAVAFSGGFAVTGALSKTAVAVSSGARSQRANLVTAALAIATALFGRPLFDYLANPVLAAVVVWAMLGMVNISYLRSLWAVGRREFSVAAVAFAGVLVLGVMPGVVVATALSLALLAHHVARPPLPELGQLPDGRWRAKSDHANASTPAGMIVCQIEGPLVFVNARSSADRIRTFTESEGVEVVVVDASLVTAIDTTAVHALGSLAAELDRKNKRLWFVVSGERVWQHAQNIAGRPIEPAFDTIDDARDEFTRRADLPSQ